MLTKSRFTAFLFPILCAGALSAQVVLSGASYTEDFNQLDTGLPDGWSIYLAATGSALGTEASASFNANRINWSTATTKDPDGHDRYFRNVAAFNTTHTGTGGGENGQAAYADRAFGWRAANADTARGALTLVIADTLGFQDFGVSVDLFTGNSTDGALTVSFEYRVGETGDFIALGTYTTNSFDNGVTTLVAAAGSLALLDNQGAQVYFRIRGVSSEKNQTHTLVIDNFELTFSPVPEPGTVAALAGLAVFTGVLATRRRRDD